MNATAANPKRQPARPEPFCANGATAAARRSSICLSIRHLAEAHQLRRKRPQHAEPPDAVGSGAGARHSLARRNTLLLAAGYAPVYRRIRARYAVMDSITKALAAHAAPARAVSGYRHGPALERASDQRRRAAVLQLLHRHEHAATAAQSSAPDVRSRRHAPLRRELAGGGQSLLARLHREALGRVIDAGPKACWRSFRNIPASRRNGARRRPPTPCR